jgi:hypothetical protein
MHLAESIKRRYRRRPIMQSARIDVIGKKWNCQWSVVSGPLLSEPACAKAPATTDN